MPWPRKLTFELLTLKVVSESSVTWATSGGNNQLYDCSTLKCFRAIKSYKQKVPSTKLLRHVAGKLITT